ncbi:histidine phosphatase family protein [Enterococcus crotali]|uniref:histidine phosphatase family protein n=1 Tax=Enterococcus crotali TaxID=1453587 RepID=UPI000684E00C|nr:histidine phosphatase family protein [Enterococcus crotali]
MKKIIYLLRHGETEFNQQGIYQGVLDSPLTPLGKIQVKENGFLLKRKLKSLEDQEIAFFYSPLGRTQQSAEIIYRVLDRHLMKPVSDEHLKEVNIGSWNGKTRQAIAAETKNKEYNEFDWYFKSPNGETYEDVQQRCKKWLEEISTIQQQHIIVMSHGLLGRVLRGSLLNCLMKKQYDWRFRKLVFLLLKKADWIILQTTMSFSKQRNDCPNREGNIGKFFNSGEKIAIMESAD